MKRGYAAQMAKGYFPLKKDFNFHLNSSRAVSSGEFKFKVLIYKSSAEALS